jgi:hypothetical protein
MPPIKVNISIADVKKPFDEIVEKDIGAIVYDHPHHPPINPRRPAGKRITFTPVPWKGL